MRIEQVQVVKAPREHVFQARTDYAVKVTERVGNNARLDAEVRFNRAHAAWKASGAQTNRLSQDFNAASQGELVTKAV